MRSAVRSASCSYASPGWFTASFGWIAIRSPSCSASQPAQPPPHAHFRRIFSSGANIGTGAGRDRAGAVRLSAPVAEASLTVAIAAVLMTGHITSRMDWLSFAQFGRV
jgi:hypothetical protein